MPEEKLQVIQKTRMAEQEYEKHPYEMLESDSQHILLLK